jgi:aryl-alcohol dehydrogenase-like predicted oxidoreductase
MSNRFRLGDDLDVNRLGFGALRLPSKDGMGGPARDPEAGRAVLRRAVELGVDHIDTADFYVSHGGAVRANSLIREALYPYPSNLVIATKVGPIIRPDGLHQAPRPTCAALSKPTSPAWAWTGSISSICASGR